MGMKPKSSVEGALRVHDISITPVSIQPNVERPLPNAGTGSMEGCYNSSVRDSAIVRSETSKPQTAQTPRSENARVWIELNERRKREAEEFDARRYTETVRL
jgi:hypothetical protein